MDELEEKLEPIYNPSEPDKKETEELIRVLSTTLGHPLTNGYAKKLIFSIREGYEEQSKQKYDGFFPEL